MKFRPTFLCLLVFNITLYVENHKLTAPVEAAPGKFPFQVAVDGFKYFCGALLLTKDFVVAPAHCLKRGSHVKVFLGFHSYPWFSSHQNETNTQIFTSTEIIFHEDFEEIGDHYLNDIALIKLPKPATFSKPGILMSKEEALLLEEKYATLIGWRSHQDLNMQFETVQILSLDNCRFIFGPEYLENQQICTKSASDFRLNLVGDILVVNEKILGYSETAYSCKLSSGDCQKYVSFHKLTPYLNWISEKVDVPISNLTGKIKGDDISIEFDKMKEEINALKVEMENTKRKLKKIENNFLLSLE